MEPSPSDLSLAGITKFKYETLKNEKYSGHSSKMMRSRAINFCRSFRVSVAVNLIPVCQSKDNKLEHVLSFFRTCSEFHLSGCHYKTFHSPKGTNTDLFHTLLALRSAFFSFVAVVSLLSGVKEENRESLLARAVNTKEPLCTR